MVASAARVSFAFVGGIDSPEFAIRARAAVVSRNVTRSLAGTALGEFCFHFAKSLFSPWPLRRLAAACRKSGFQLRIKSRSRRKMRLRFVGFSLLDEQFAGMHVRGNQIRV
jgi:hypothetical protein